MAGRKTTNKTVNKGGGQPGNKNAEKYTLEVVAEIAARLEEYTEIQDCLMLEEACLAVGILPQNYSEFLKKFGEEPLVSEPLTRAKMRIAVRLNRGGLKNDFNAKMVELNLKNNYG